MRLVLLALAVPVICMAQAPAQPRLVLEPEQYDFGKVVQDTTVVHRFQVSNGGGSPLRLVRVAPSCGCTSSLVGKDTLAPGESTEIEVTFNPAGFQGLVRKSVSIESNDPAGPMRSLSFQAEVIQAAGAAETTVRFLDLTRKDRRKHSVRVRSFNGKPISVDNAELSEAPWLGVATRPDGNDQWVDLVLLARNLPKDKLEGTDKIDLHLSNPSPSTVHLDVYWQVRPPVSCSPERVAWSGDSGQEQQATLTLTDLAHRRFRILSARTSNPLLQVGALPERAATRQSLAVTLAGSAPPGTYEEKVFLTLDSPGHPEWAIRVAAVLK